MSTGYDPHCEAKNSGLMWFFWILGILALTLLFMSKGCQNQPDEYTKEPNKEIPFELNTPGQFVRIPTEGKVATVEWKSPLIEDQTSLSWTSHSHMGKDGGYVQQRCWLRPPHQFPIPAQYPEDIGFQTFLLRKGGPVEGVLKLEGKMIPVTP